MRIQDDEGFLEFDGDQIAVATTEENERTLRWTEVHIFRTSSGKYVVQKIGKTRVYHRGSAEGPCAKYGKPGKYQNVDLDAIGCPVCNPDLDDDDNVRIETDRYTAHVSDTAKGAVESIHSQDNDGVTYLTRVAREALHVAARKDEDIHDAFFVRTVE
jgi:hypothetical protein